jgi:subtilisin family serine protease
MQMPPTDASSLGAHPQDMWRLCSILFAAPLLAALSLAASANSDGSSVEPVTFQLEHTLLSIHPSSLAAAHTSDIGTQHLKDAADAAAAAAAVSLRDEDELSDLLFHKSRFAMRRRRSSPSPASGPCLHSLGVQPGDKQFFVAFSARTDVRTLAALHAFAGRRVLSYVQGNLYLAIGGHDFPAKARRFPGVAWVQERDALSKLGGSLQKALQGGVSVAGADGAGLGWVEVVAECWFDGCEAAAEAARSACPDVYLHLTLIEVHCNAAALPAAVSLLSRHVAVDHVDVKHATQLFNAGGRSIIGNGPRNSNLSRPSLVLSSINVSSSIIAVADSGIDLNNCFFYDNSSAAPANNSRVVLHYSVQPCDMCGRCCTRLSPPGCSNQTNACGNRIDQSGHGTHVVGTIAGVGPRQVAYGDGIAAGAKIFFQDIENILPTASCFRHDLPACSGALSAPTDLYNLFAPAFTAGARVHSNSWGSNIPTYTDKQRAADAFIHDNPTFLILFAAGNDGVANPNRVLGSNHVTCKNCLSVGATQQSDELFRSMSPFIDDGAFCPFSALLSNRSNGTLAADACCADPLTCVNRCCSWTNVANMSLACCALQTTCSPPHQPCSVQSGNIRSATNVAAFSGRGPTLDGRFKPDLVAPGEDILSAATPNQASAAILGQQFNVTSPDHCGVPSKSRPRTPQEAADSALKALSGTSMATPLVAGAVEKIRQYFVQGYYPLGLPASGTAFEPDEALVRAVVLASCVSVVSDPSWALWAQRTPLAPGFFRFPLPSEYSPNFFQGFGMPVLDQAVYVAGATNGYRMIYTNGTFTPSSSASAFSVICDPSLASIPLTLALVWTDPPGSVSSQKQLVNDLDLIVLSTSGNPSQMFGNMRPFADQSNTVERVVTRCPAAGVVTAVVAPGDAIKTSSQRWYMVANGPVVSITSVSVPPYSSGRASGPVTQSQNCSSSPAIVTTVNFKPAAAWPCSGPQGLLSCSVKRAIFATSLANIVGVAVQAVSASSSDTTRLEMSLSCSVMINSWRSAGNVSLKFVTPRAVLSAINASVAMFQEDAFLSAFDWAAFANATAPVPSPSAEPSALPAPSHQRMIIIVSASVAAALLLAAVCLFIFRARIKKTCACLFKQSGDVAQLKQAMVSRGDSRRFSE